MNDLYEVCLKFRNALNIVPKEKLSFNFKEFPHGSCGDTCLMLGSYLDESGFGFFDYVCGIRNECSHAWLEKNGIIVDITADQFVDCDIEVYVGQKNSFYQSFDEDFRHKYYETLDGGSLNTDRLWTSYKIICQFL
jgi:hypothetical protein